MIANAESFILTCKMFKPTDRFLTAVHCRIAVASIVWVGFEFCPCFVK